MALTEERFKELMAAMTEKQNRDIEERIVTKMEQVKNEMTGAINDISVKQNVMEKDQQNLKEEVQDIKEQMTVIKNTLKIPQVPSFSEILQGSGTGAPRVNCKSSEPKTMYPVSDDTGLLNEQIDKLIDHSRRTISLHPLTQKDIDFELKRGAGSENEAKLWAVQTFLRYEMNIKAHVQETFRILSIHPPVGDNFDRIYVTFSDITTVNSIFSYTRNMRRDVKVDLYVPPECRDRYKALQSIAYKERHEDGIKKNQTRIKWGEKDFILYKKPLGTRNWSVVPVVELLPPVDLSAVEVPPVHLSPAPGRQSRDTSKRIRSDGSGSSRDESLPKNRKVDNPDNQDTGRVVEEESYCPASPAPAKGLKCQPQINSPIFSKNKTQTFSPIPSRMNPLIQ